MTRKQKLKKLADALKGERQRTINLYPVKPPAVPREHPSGPNHSRYNPLGVVYRGNSSVRSVPEGVVSSIREAYEGATPLNEVLSTRSVNRTATAQGLVQGKLRTVSRED